MAGKTCFMQNKILDFIFRGQALGITGGNAAAGSGPTTLWIGLLTTQPNDNSAGVEVVTTGGTNYTRAAVTSGMGASGWSGTQSQGSTTFSSGTGLTGGTISNNGVLTFGSATPGANWGTIQAIGIYDAATPGTGNLLYWALLTPNKTVNNGDAQPTFQPGALQITED